MSEQEVLERFGNEPITVARLVSDLRELGLEAGMTAIVHSSLSKIGWVCGGPVALILALEEVLRDHGTLVMPTHSGDLSDPAHWRNPPVPQSWWATIRETMPAFDPELTPTRGVGIVPEVFRAQLETVRSVHPAVSFAAWGGQAIAMTSDHPLDYSLGEQSPLGALYRADGWVLMLGTDFDTNTSFHLAEYRAEYPMKEVVRLGAPVLVEGHRRWLTYEDINYDASDFVKLGREFQKRQRRSIRAGSVGNADARLFAVRDCVDFAVDWFARHRR